MKAKILVVEDSESQGQQLTGSLEQRGYQVSWVRSGIEALQRARTFQPDIVILDVVLEDVDGFTVCRWLKVDKATRDTPVIMLTVRGEPRDKIEGLHVGADDYLPKPFNSEELEARIYAALRVRARQVELQQRNAELESMLHSVERMAVTDALTGLFNRRHFEEALRREVAVARRYGHTLCCILLDIDHFKSVNDMYGHAVGDQVLKQVAECLGGGLREVDFTARYGGEEFAVLLPHTPRSNSAVVAERIALAIRRIQIEVGHEQLSITASMGIASTDEVKAKDPHDLVRAADAALYRAKRLGRDRTVYYDPKEDAEPARER